MSKYPQEIRKISKILKISRNISYFWLKNKPILNPLGQTFPKRELKSMSWIVYTSIMKRNSLNNMDAKVNVFSLMG